MTRKFIAAVAGAALVVTAIGAAPARADENLARALAAIVGVAIVGKVISDRLDHDDRVVSRNRHDDHNMYWQHDRNPAASGIRRAGPRPPQRHARRYLLPGDCLHSWTSRGERHRVFGKRCLKRNYEYTDSLPRRCEVTIRVNNKKRRGYDARCLRRAGYQLARW